MCDFSPDPNARDVLTFDRTYDDILLEAESAKLGDKTCYANTIVCTASSVSNKYSSADDSFKVFQLTEKQTELLLSNSTSFTIKSGPKNENCMVFTEDKSFNIRSSETSNTLLFVSHLHPAKGCLKISYFHEKKLNVFTSKRLPCSLRFNLISFSTV